MRRMGLAIRILSLVACGVAVFGAEAGAQQAALKRAIPMTESRAPCPPAQRSAYSPPSAEQAEQAARLVTAGIQASIIGDHSGAQELLARAARLDPTAEHIAFHLARAYEGLGETDAAVGEYCRYLELAPDAADAAEVRRRIDQLVPAPEPRFAPGAIEQFRAGLEAFDGGRFATAEAAFGRAITAAGDWADPYYNRAVVRMALGMREAAAEDFERYLDVARDAEDAGLVRAQIEQLRIVPRRFSSGVAVATGLLVPGLGQFYTRRPFLGTLVMAGAGAGAVLALRTESAIERREYTDPFGNPYFEDTLVETRPHLLVGAAVTGAVLVAAAIEAGFYARRASGERAGGTGPRGALEVGPGALRLAVPHVERTAGRVAVRLIQVGLGAR